MPAEYSLLGGFDRALIQLKMGDCVAREGWNGKNMWLCIQRPDEHSKMSLPYIFMCTADGGLVPWVASQTDLLSMDWQRVSFDH